MCVCAAHSNKSLVSHTPHPCPCPRMRVCLCSLPLWWVHHFPPLSLCGDRYQLSSRSWSLTEEKAKMKEIVGVKQKMGQFVEMSSIDTELTTLREAIDQVCMCVFSVCACTLCGEHAHVVVCWLGEPA